MATINVVCRPSFVALSSPLIVWLQRKKGVRGGAISCLGGGSNCMLVSFQTMRGMARRVKVLIYRIVFV